MNRISIWTNHLLVPESETSTHYFFGYTRNFCIHDEEMTKLLFDGSVMTYLEDKAMLEAQQQKLHGGVLERMIDLNMDAGALPFVGPDRTDVQLTRPASTKWAVDVHRGVREDTDARGDDDRDAACWG